MDNRADNKQSTTSPRIRLGGTLADSGDRTVGSCKSGPPKVALDDSRVMGDPMDGRTVGGEKSGSIYKVRLDSARVMGDSVEGRTVGGKKSGLIGKVHVDPSRVMAAPGDGKTRSGGTEK